MLVAYTVFTYDIQRAAQMAGEDDEMPGIPQHNVPTDSETDDDAMNEIESGTEESDIPHGQGINGVERAAT